MLKTLRKISDKIKLAKMRSVILFAFIGTLLFAETACTRVEISGNQIDFDKVSQISRGDNISNVIKLMGSPTYATNYGELEYMYISERLIHKPIIMPRLESLDMVVVSFDDSNLVSDVEIKRNLDANSAVDRLDDKTVIEGNKLNPFRQIIGNIGKYNASNKAPGIR